MPGQTSIEGVLLPYTISYEFDSFKPQGGQTIRPTEDDCYVDTDAAVIAFAATAGVRDYGSAASIALDAAAKAADELADALPVSKRGSEDMAPYSEAIMANMGVAIEEQQEVPVSAAVVVVALGVLGISHVGTARIYITDDQGVRVLTADHVKPLDPAMLPLETRLEQQQELANISKPYELKKDGLQNRFSGRADVIRALGSSVCLETGEREDHAETAGSQYEIEFDVSDNAFQETNEAHHTEADHAETVEGDDEEFEVDYAAVLQQIESQNVRVGNRFRLAILSDYIHLRLTGRDIEKILMDRGSARFAARSLTLAARRAEGLRAESAPDDGYPSALVIDFAESVAHEEVDEDEETEAYVNDADAEQAGFGTTTDAGNYPTFGYPGWEEANTPDNNPLIRWRPIKYR